MSLFTRCPNCLTTFRVVPDQLRISDGWVRCGQCQHVFDANAALVDGETAAVPVPVPEEVPALPALPRQPLQPDVAVQTEAAAEAAAVETAPTADAKLGEVDELDVDLDLNLDKGAGASSVEAVASPIEIAPMAPVQPDPSFAEGENPSFMRPMPQRFSWQRTSLRVLLALVALGLLAALGLQVAVQERDRMAALFPQTKPALQWICQRLNCTVSNLRQIESVVIDSSSFNKIRPDAYRLGIVLRNTSAVDIAMPALELTLTDSRDQPVMRRVLLADEFSPVVALGAASDWTGSVAITVRGNGSDRFAGYKVLAFYP